MAEIKNYRFMQIATVTFDGVESPQTQKKLLF